MPFAESTNLLDAMRDLLAQMPGSAEALTVTGVRRDGVWKVQGSVPVQRQPARCCGPWAGHGHAPTCEVAAR